MGARDIGGGLQVQQQSCVVDKVNQRGCEGWKGAFLSWGLAVFGHCDSPAALSAFLCLCRGTFHSQAVDGKAYAESEVTCTTSRARKTRSDLEYGSVLERCRK